MNKIRKLEATPTGYVSRNDFKEEFIAEVKEVDEIEVQDPQVYFCKEYRLEMRVGITFRANRCMYQAALEEAKRGLSHNLYRDVMTHVDVAMRAVYAGDAEETLRHLSLARKEME